jgi:hypothetical protein
MNQRGKSDANFEESVARYEKFLKENGYPPRVVWVRWRDVLLTGRRQIFVRTPVPTTNEGLARTAFNDGIAKKLGILFATVCEMDGVTCCRAWVPADEDEAERSLMPEGLKLSVTTGESRLYGKAVTNRIGWFWLKLKYRQCQHLKDFLFSG